MNPEILYLDNHLLVVNKPAGLLSQADRTGDPDVLEWGKAWLKNRFNKPGAVFLGLVHRLDRPVSGVMVLARTSKSASRLGDQMRRKTMSKHYLAVVERQLTGSGTWTDYLVKEDERVRVVEPGTRGAQEAVLHYQVLDHVGGLTLVAVRLETGRAHQIRVQFSSRRHPLLGDVRYAARKKLDGKNLALHCARMAIDHPTKEERIGFNAEPPGTWPDVFRPAASEWLDTLGPATRL